MIAVYDWFGYELPIRERYRLIREAGFDGVLMWWSDGFGRGEYRDGPELARGAGLLLENIHAPIQGQNDLFQDNLDGESLAQRYLRCVEDCAAFAIPAVVVHLPEDRSPWNALGVDRVKRLAERAERLGVNVALENVRNFANLAAILAQVDSPRVGFCYDCCHHVNYNPDRDLPALYGPRMMALHLHDNGGSRGQHRLPFDGGMDWPAVMKNVADTGYAGATALEPMNWDYLDLSPEEFLQAAAGRAGRLEELRTRP